MNKPISLALAVLLAAAAPALAHEEHDHDARTGGMVMETSGHHHIELVARDGALEAYITHEDGEPEDVNGAKATATVLSGGATEQVELVPAGENALKGTGSFKVDPGTVVVITLTMPDHSPEQARFTFD
jgi:hypothetical protein